MLEISAIALESIRKSFLFPALKPQNMTEDGQLRDYDLRGQVLRASLVTELKLASTDEDTACYGQYEDAACRRKLGQSVLAAFCADKLMAQPE